MWGKKKPFAKLRGRIEESGYSRPELSKEVWPGSNSLTDRLTCRVGFQMIEVYRLCGILGIPFDQIPEYFTPDDCSQAEKQRLRKKEESAC